MNIKWEYTNLSVLGYEYWSMYIEKSASFTAVIYHNNAWRMKEYGEPEWEVHCSFIQTRTLPPVINNAEEAKRYVEALYRLEG